MIAINRQADRAENAKPHMLSRYDLARELHASFNEMSVEEIAETLELVWRTRGLFFATVNGRM